MALDAGHGGVFAFKFELRSLVVDKGEVLAGPSSRGMTGGTLGGELFSMDFFVAIGAFGADTFEKCRCQGSAVRLWFVAFEACNRLMFVEQFKGGVRIMNELELVARPALGRVAPFAGARELRVVGVTMARRAGVIFQSGEIDSGHGRRALFLVAFVTGDLSVLAIPFEVGQAVIELLSGQYHERCGASGMLLVARHAFPFEGAVIASQGGSALLDIGMTFLALGTGDLTTVGMAFDAGLGGFSQAMPSREVAGLNAVRKGLGKLGFYRCQLPLVENDEGKGGDHHSDCEPDEGFAGNQHLAQQRA